MLPRSLTFVTPHTAIDPAHVKNVECPGFRRQDSYRCEKLLERLAFVVKTIRLDYEKGTESFPVRLSLRLGIIYCHGSEPSMMIGMRLNVS